jgi:GNAT superfamily N-acetyltransferase
LDCPVDIVVVRDPNQADRDAIVTPLIAFNLSKVHTERPNPLAILIKQEGRVIGGLSGRFSYDWLFVELLFVPESLRGSGLGSRILLQAEQIATGHGCIGVWLDTYEFQARGFYEKLGYSLFGSLDDHPRGMSRFFLQKRLDAREMASSDT